LYFHTEPELPQIEGTPRRRRSRSRSQDLGFRAGGVPLHMSMRNWYWWDIALFWVLFCRRHGMEPNLGRAQHSDHQGTINPEKMWYFIYYTPWKHLFLKNINNFSFKYLSLFLLILIFKIFVTFFWREKIQILQEGYMFFIDHL
jgi:hypothetical protein